MYHDFLIHSSANEHLGCFHVLAIVNSAAMNNEVYASFSVLISSGYKPSRGIAGSYGSFIPSEDVYFNFCFQLFPERNLAKSRDLCSLLPAKEIALLNTISNMPSLVAEGEMESEVLSGSERLGFQPRL